MNSLFLLVRSLRTIGVRQLFFLTLAQFRKNLLQGSPSGTQTLSLKELTHPITLRPGSSDIRVFKQIFLTCDYKCPSGPHADAIAALYKRLVAKGKTPLIIDCGANTGLSAIWYATQYPKAHIIAVEPEPSNFSLLQLNVTPYSKIRAIQKGVSDHAGRVSLSNTGGTPWAWQTVETDDGGIETCTIDELRQLAPDYVLMIVKIDIEGGEKTLFRSNIDWVVETPVIVFEAHDWLYPWTGSFHSFVKALTTTPRDYVHHGENTFALAHSLMPT